MKTLFPVLALLTLAFAACRPVAPAGPMQYGTVNLHIQSYVNSNLIDTSQIAVDATGRRFKLKIAQFYFCGIVLRNTNGNAYPFGSFYGLNKPGSAIYYLGSVPVGTYSSSTFSVGLDALTNSLNPNTYPLGVGNPLALQTPSMWFGSTSEGYIFMNVQGLADTTAANNGPCIYPFSYQTGGFLLERGVDLISPIIAGVGLSGYTIYPNQTYVVNIKADFGLLLKGINFQTQNMANPYSTTPAVKALAGTIAGNIPYMFSYQ